MKENKKYLLGIGTIVILLGIAITFVFMNKPNAQDTLAKDTLVVGMELKFPPFETVDTKGKPMGVSVDMAYALGDILGKQVTIKDVDFASLIPALQSEQIDLIISSMTITPERLESIAFSDEYARSDLALMLHKETEAATYEALNKADYTIAAKQGTIGAMWVKKFLPEAKLKEFTEIGAAVLDVNNGYSNAFIYDPLSLIESSQTMTNVKLLLDPLPDVAGWGIGMRKEDTALKESINKALLDIKANHFFDEMREKYLKDDVKKYESYGLDYLF